MRAQLLLAVAMATLLAVTTAQASVEINANPTKNMSCSGGICSPTAKSAVLNTTDLANMLSAGDVKVTTGNGAVTITVSAPFSWTSTHRLTLDAALNVSFRAPVEVAGAGAVTVNANVENGGDLLFFPGGKLDFWDTDSNFTFNGTSYVLVSDIASLAAAYATAPNNFAVIAFTKDYDARHDGAYNNAAVPTDMEGQFEGLGHTVSNFSASGSSREVGFFSQSFSGVIRDLTLSNIKIKGADNSLTGALGGALNATITNVHASGLVSAGDNSSVGGLVGDSTGGKIVGSTSSATVTCAKRCSGGGLVGLGGGQFFSSHATGTVTVTSGNAGGLIGFLRGTVSQSFATGDVASKRSKRAVTIGGLVGLADQNSTIVDSYALGAIRNAGSGSAGGLIGSGKDNSVATSYATGHIGVDGARRKQISGTGGFVGSVYFPDQYTQNYWNTDTSGQDQGCGGSQPAGACPNIQGQTDAELKAGLPGGFSNTVWAQNPGINNGYPYLLANPPPQ